MAERRRAAGRQHAVDPVHEAVTRFGRAVATKFGRGGGPEDQLRGPVENLFTDLGAYVGLDTVAYGEVVLKDLRARPDYAVDIGNSRVGYIELKAPGRKIPPDWRPNKHERDQWEKLRALPNLIYTDGTKWSRYCYGEPAAPVVHLGGSLIDVNKPLYPIGRDFELMIRDFLLWEPERPRSLLELIRVVAGLCRLLRDEVQAVLSSGPDRAGREDLQLLAEYWRNLLFPGLQGEERFSDAYAQTITFAMLLARVNGIAFDDTPLHEIARLLGKKHSLMGTAFSVLTDSDATDELRSIETLRRVIGVTDWTALDDGHSNVYAELYERFLAEYDPSLRKQSGTYYTPEPVARFMVEFVDEILQTQLARPWGFAADDVFVVDPAMGTGTFLVEIMRVVAETVERKQGVGARAAHLRELFQQRLIGFEYQVAPYAVAELRLHQALKTRFGTDIPSRDVRYLTDALENPGAQQERVVGPHKVMNRVREGANKIKREIRVMVVIGNPPHVENARDQALWIENRRKTALQPGTPLSRPSLDEFRTEGNGRYESDLSALQWYFWRWATWKVFDAHPDKPMGVVAFITPSSYTTGRAFAGMREYLRRTCDEGWIIDVSPAGNRSGVETRIFAGVQRPLCIGVFARYDAAQPRRPAIIHRASVDGTREEKLRQLQQLSLGSARWVGCRMGWQDPFLPGGGPNWDSYPKLCDLMPWTSRGVTAGRTWIYAPDERTLDRRWREFIRADLEERRALFGEARDRKITTVVGALPGFSSTGRSLADERGSLPQPIRVGYRSFDRQWVVPDNRLMAVPRPPLWAVRSEQQVYVTEQSSHPVDSGPGLTFSGLIPDIHHYNARSGRVLPLYREPTGTTANLAPGLVDRLGERLCIAISESDLLAYLAAIVAHPGYTRRFKRQLEQPGIRVPLTSIPDLWRRAQGLGSQVVWLHTYGERYVDEEAGRPFGVEKLTESSEARVLSRIPDTTAEMPNEFGYDPSSLTLRVGRGSIAPVSREVWEYDVGGMRIVRKWLDYRMREPRHKRRSSALDHINCDRWTTNLTTELLQLLAVLEACIRLEPAQDELLRLVCDSPVIDVQDLTQARVFPVAVSATKPAVVPDPDRPPLY